jgi:hypothetical protein
LQQKGEKMLNKISTIKKIKNKLGLSIVGMASEIGCHPHHFMFLQNLRYLPTGKTLIKILNLIRRHKLSNEFTVEQILDDYICINLEEKTDASDRAGSTSRKTSKRTVRTAAPERNNAGRRICSGVGGRRSGEKS